MKVTLKDIAERVNVSVSTVSRVLNNTPTSIDEEIRNDIFNISRELGYKKHMKHMEKNRNISEMQVGLILNNSKNKYKDPYFSEIIYGIEQELMNQGLNIRFTLDEQELEGSMLPSKFAGDDTAIIVVGPINNSSLQALKEQVSVIISVGGIPSISIDYVTIDFIESAMMAVNHLLNLGHRNIAFIGGNELSEGVITGESRYQGYEQALRNSNIPLKREWIKNGSFTVNGGYQAMKEILSFGHLPTAIFIASDRMSYGAYKAIQEKGLTIPKDISIISFDDLEMSPFLNPPLTTVRVHKEELGRISVKLLSQRIMSEITLPLTTYLPTELIVRKSCGNNKNNK
ncbi:LacI family DNA-binding transcriptional regulator [Oceanobacillus sp. Castelsardo]|uniref:LacI family DNA-binding transcriptional regulator n=1 Tax=Oceanobacillus sp. Castelsardo TaxID=1851204 RepID=UPI000837D351|nr:LacI family DNA-binding transcriptional regulator [Oceanobacillus sp. Castelsardo]